MIYLENKTLLQDVYIPRQDMLPYTTGSSGTYAEGYSDGFESGYTSGSTDGFDSGYTEGYTSGETHQKGLLSSTAFTENGVYTREDGWDEVEVSVEAPLPVLEDKTVVISADTTTVSPSSGYDGMSAVTVDASEYAQDNYDGGFEDGFSDGYSSGTTDGFNSGYTSGYTSGHTDGVSEEKSKLSATTFTANTAVTISDGGYSAVTVNVAQTGHTDQELEDASDSGYTSGQTDQKNLLTTTAFTENGSYQRENGWSGVTVNINTASTYNSGWTDGYDSGYTSGETHQKSLLVSTAFTENGEYQRENGYSAITVNVPTGQTYNIEQNKPFTATTNGDYTITPSTASTTIDRDYFDSDVDRYYLTATTSGYPSTGLFELFLIEDEFDSSKGSITVYFDDGVLDYDITKLTLSANTTVEIYENTIEIVVRNANSGFGYTTLSDFNYSYDVMSAVSLNVNVDTASTYQSGYTSGHTDGVSEEKAKLSAITFTANTAITISDGGYSAITIDVQQSSGSVISLVDSIYTQSMDWDSTKCIDTMITATTATTMRIGYVGAGIGSDRVIGYDWMDTGISNQGWRYFNGYSDTNTVDLNLSRKQGGSPTRESGVEYDITLGNNYLYDNINESYLVAQGDVQSSLTPVSIRVDVGSQKVKFVEIKDNDVTVFYGQAAIDSDGNIGLYDSVSMSMVYNSALTMTYEGTPTPIPSQDYQSGYTDGFNSGYTSGVTDGENNIISTFSSMTATTNGVYGSSAHPLSSITVDVPQSGGGSTNAYIHATTLSANTQNCIIDTGIYPTTATTFRVKGQHKGLEQSSVVVGYGDNDNADYRIFWAGNGGQNFYFDFNSDRIDTSMSSFVDGYEVDLRCGNFYVQSGNGTSILTGQQQSTISDPHTIKIDVGSWWVKSLEIWDGQTKVFNGVASEQNGSIGLLDSVTGNLFVPSNSAIPMTYERDEMPLSSITITANTAITSTDVAYTGITVNVPIVHTPFFFAEYIHNTTLVDNSDSNYIDTGIYPTTATTFRVQGMTKGYGQGNVIVGYMGNENAAYRLFWWNWYSTGSHLTFDFNNQRIDNMWGGSYDGRIVDITCSNYQAVSGDGTTLMTGTTQTTIDDPHTILTDVGSWWLKSLEIWQGNTKVFDGRAAYDVNGKIGLYDSVSGQLLAPTNSSEPMSYEI